MSKEIKYGSEAQEAVVKGINAVADIVKTTIGPKGRNVLIRELGAAPTITNDGVTIAKSIKLKDNTEDAGASLVISAANKTNDVAGDGTTTTTVFASKLINNGFKMIAEDSLNPVQLQKEMIAAGNEISNRLKEMAIEVRDDEAIKRVATISSGSETTGKLIANAFSQAGEYGNVIVEDSKTGITGLSTVMGMKLPNGSVTPYLLDRVTQSSEIEDVSVLVSRDKLDNVPDLLPILDGCAQEGRRLLIICDDIDFEPLNFVVMNKARGAINVNIIRLPGFNEELRANMTEDICIATGATLISRDQGRPIKQFTPEWFGELQSAKIEMDETVLKFKDVSSFGVNLHAQRLERVDEIKQQLEKVPVNGNKTEYERRIANLVGGISVIEVGGNSDVEIKDTKLRIEDALNSVKAAREEGIVAGGGYSFLKVYMDIADTKKEGNAGERLVYDTLLTITKQIAENAGFDGDEVVAHCFNEKLGFNALTGKYEDLIKTGVINAAKVDRYCILNAVSVASTVLTMGGAIIEENEKDQNLLQLVTQGVPVIG